MRISPASGSSKPMICLSKTLLPLPLGPMMTKISPGLTSKSRPLSTSWPLKLRRRPWTFTLTPRWFGLDGVSFMARSEQQSGQYIIQEHDENDAIDHRFGDGAPDAAR